MNQVDQRMPTVPASPKTSGVAIASLVCGLTGCIPAVTSLAAIVLGIVGLRSTRRPDVRGRGLAIAGLVLGIAGLLGWCGFGVTMYGIYTASEAPAQEAEMFLREMASVNTQAAAARCGPPMTAEAVAAMAPGLAKWGQFKSLSLSSRSANVSGGITTWEFGGKAIFDKARAMVKFTIVRRPDGTCRITAVKLVE